MLSEVLGKTHRKTCILTTEDGAPRHKHLAILDKDGNGWTSIDSDHRHKIIEYKIMPAGHDHRLTRIPGSE